MVLSRRETFMLAKFLDRSYSVYVKPNWVGLRYFGCWHCGSSSMAMAYAAAFKMIIVVHEAAKFATLQQVLSRRSCWCNLLKPADS